MKGGYMGMREAFNYIPSPYIPEIQYTPDVTSKYGVPKPESLRNRLEQITRFRAYLLRTILIHLINSGMVYMTEGFRDLAESFLPLCNQVIANMDLYLRTMGINVARYLLDVYDLGEGEYSELKPFIEVYVYVKDINEMLRIWENTVNFLRSTLGDSMLEYVDIFFTRAR